MSDFSNFRAVYNELTDAVTSSRYQFFRDHLASFFDGIDQTPNAAHVVSELESRVDLIPWYEECKKSVTDIGNGSLDWPKGRANKLAMKVALLRALSAGEIEIDDFTSHFLYANDYDVNVREVANQIFRPTVRELLRHIEERFDKAVPASDRVVPIDHNSEAYADADKALENLEKAIREANDFHDPIEKEQRGVEVSAARQLLKAKRVQLEPLALLLKPILIQFATKVKDSLITAAATLAAGKLIALLGAGFKALLKML